MGALDQLSRIKAALREREDELSLLGILLAIVERVPADAGEPVMQELERIRRVLDVERLRRLEQ